MKKDFILVLICALTFSSCKPNLDYEIHGYTQKIIVEGFIANGEFPRVYLSLNNPVWQTVDSVSIMQNVIGTAKVTVSDGENSEVLTSFLEKTHFPPYVYRGTSLKGIEGKTYYLKVEYSGYTIHSQTTIPYGTNINNFKTEPVVGNDSLVTLWMTFHIESGRKNSFRVFTKKKMDEIYTETPLLFNAGFSLSGDQTFQIAPRPRVTAENYTENSNFIKGDTIMVRFCTIDSVSTQFFKDLTLFSSSTGIANMIYIGQKDALKSNISSPGFGIWHGDAVRTYQVVIK